MPGKPAPRAHLQRQRYEKNGTIALAVCCFFTNRRRHSAKNTEHVAHPREHTRHKPRKKPAGPATRGNGRREKADFAAPLPLCLPFAPHRRKKHNLCLMIRLHSGKKQKIAARFPFSFRSFALSFHKIRLHSGKKQKIAARFPFSFRSFALSLPAQACCTPVPTEHFHIPKTRHMKKLLTLAMAATLCLGMGARPAAEADNADRPKTECPCKDCKCDECNGRCTDGCTECRPCHRRGHDCDDECRPCHRRGHDCDDECRPCHRHHAKHHRGHHRGCCR